MKKSGDKVFFRMIFSTPLKENTKKTPILTFSPKILFAFSGKKWSRQYITNS